jgi:hypothetical protein
MMAGWMRSARSWTNTPNGWPGTAETVQQCVCKLLKLPWRLIGRSTQGYRILTGCGE